MVFDKINNLKPIERRSMKVCFQISKCFYPGFRVFFLSARFERSLLIAIDIDRDHDQLLLNLKASQLK